MDPLSSSRESSMPVPMEGLHEAGPSPFLIKTYEMVDDLNTNQSVSWNRGGISFVVWDPHSFSANILPLQAQQLLQLCQTTKRLLSEELNNAFVLQLLLKAVENVSELEALALEIQGHGRQWIDGVERELDVGFWKELLMSNDEEEADVKQN